MRQSWEIDPHSPVALLDNWLDERGFPPRKRVQMNSGWDHGNKDLPVIQIFRPHGKEWLFSFAPKTIGNTNQVEDPLAINLWGPGMIEHGMVADFHLADPSSFDEVTSIISAWRKTKHSLYKEVWRYINILNHQTSVHPATSYEHWIISMSAEYFRFHNCNEDYKRVRDVLKSAGVELGDPENT